jgi:hypothetical protein
MVRFVIADISGAKSVLQELRAIVPVLPSVPVQPIILAMQEEPGMFDFYRPYPWFLPVLRYASQEQLIADFGEKVIRPAEAKGTHALHHARRLSLSRPSADLPVRRARGPTRRGG